MEAQPYQAGMTASGGLEEFQDGGPGRKMFYNHSVNVLSAENTAFHIFT